jgi:hypothetical protein
MLIISHNQDIVPGYPCNSVEVIAFGFIVSVEMWEMVSERVVVQNILFLFQIFRHSFLASYEIVDLQTR